MDRIPPYEHEYLVLSPDGIAPPPPPPPPGSWAAWVARWEPAYLWHSAAIQVAIETRLRSGAKCRVISERREDERSRYWVWRVRLA